MMSKTFKFVCYLLALVAFAIPSSVSAVGQNFSEESINTSESQLIVSDVLTYEQMIKEIAYDYGISEEQAQIQIGYTEDMAQKAIQEKATFRTLSQMFTVNTSYKPTMRFYCETSESGSFRAIKKILEVNMIRGYNGLSKQFTGNVYVNLEDANRIFYIVNGDFYNNGTTSWNAGVSIGVGGSATVKFGISGASSHYQYRYVESRIVF
ncbi:MAG: hypothetical protein ACI32O_07460 [Enterococcus sp.]